MGRGKLVYPTLGEASWPVALTSGGVNFSTKGWFGCSGEGEGGGGGCGLLLFS